MLAGVASDISQQVLRTDVAGMPLEWIDYREAVRLYHAEQVAYDCGTLLYTVFGGYSSFDGCRSKIDVNSIIATHGTSQSLSRNRDKYIPPLNNRTLFKRDANLCLYCAMRYPTRDLTRDHITPISQGGGDHWNNVATACRRCLAAACNSSRSAWISPTLRPVEFVGRGGGQRHREGQREQGEAEGMSVHGLTSR